MEKMNVFKKINIIILVVVVIIAAIFFFNYFEKEAKNKAAKTAVIKSQRAPAVKEGSKANPIKMRTFIPPFNFLGLEINNIDKNESAPVLTEAFGLRKNQPFDESKAVEKLELSSGTSMYEIVPIVEDTSDGRYFITVDEKTKYPETYRSITTFDTKEELDKEMSHAEQVLSQKYDFIFDKDDLKYYKDARGNLVILFVKKVGDKYELRLNCLCFR